MDAPKTTENEMLAECIPDNVIALHDTWQVLVLDSERLYQVDLGMPPTIVRNRNRFRKALSEVVQGRCEQVSVSYVQQYMPALAKLMQTERIAICQNADACHSDIAMTFPRLALRGVIAFCGYDDNGFAPLSLESLTPLWDILHKELCVL